jgi:ribonuclease HI
VQTKELYQLTEEGITQHPRMWHDYDEDGQPVNQIPSTAIPIDVTKGQHTLRLQPYLNNGSIVETTPTDTNNIQQIFRTLQKWQSELLQNMILQGTVGEIKEAVRQPLRIASDGSVQGNRASFGWIISTATGTRLATCAGPAFGCKPTSYRAEGYGILSVLQFFQLASEQWGTIGPCHIVCDNEALVKQLGKTNEYTKTQPNQTMIAEWDILIEIWETMAKMRDIRIQHIKGHSDEKQPYENSHCFNN